MATAIASGALLGVCARLGDHLPGIFPWLANIGGPWLLVAFVVGRRTGSWPVQSAAATLLAAVGAKYLFQHIEGGFSALHALRRAAVWSIPAASLGSAGGWLGGRRNERPRMAAMLMSVALVIEASGLLSGVIRGESAELRYSGQAAGTAVLTLEFVIGFVGIIVASTRRPWARGH
jgi:hypothetical protein